MKPNRLGPTKFKVVVAQGGLGGIEGPRYRGTVAVPQFLVRRLSFRRRLMRGYGSPNVLSWKSSVGTNTFVQCS